jgi:glycerate-2-kinase
MIKNSSQLRENTSRPILKQLRSDALHILEHALESVNPHKAVMKHVSLNEQVLTVGSVELNLTNFERVIVVGGGKASGAMAEEVERILGDFISVGQVNILRGTADHYKTNIINLKEADHPVPTHENVKATNDMLKLISDLTEKDLVLVLLSGGGSALMAKPSSQISLSDLQKVTGQLLRAGASIEDLNTVRKHLSEIKGGQLAEKAYPARVISLILSDVIGNSLDVIASGPTYPDSSTYADALKVLNKYKLSDRLPGAILEVLRDGRSGAIKETTKPGNPIFNKTYYQIIGSVKTACRACSDMADELGYKPIIVSTELQGEARKTGATIAENALDLKENGRVTLVYGGETTVNVKGTGRGGRNQEMALSALKVISGLNVVLAAFGTDGLDGDSVAAGALVDGESFNRAEHLELNPTSYLNDNNSYSFFKALDDCIMTGSTGTNVNDITLILINDQTEKSKKGEKLHG